MENQHQRSADKFCDPTFKFIWNYYFLFLNRYLFFCSVLFIQLFLSLFLFEFFLFFYFPIASFSIQNIYNTIFVNYNILHNAYILYYIVFRTTAILELW